MEVDSTAQSHGGAAPAPASTSAAGPSTSNGGGESVGATTGDSEMTDAPPGHPEGASEVIYLNGLNEKIKLDGQPQRSASPPIAPS